MLKSRFTVPALIVLWACPAGADPLWEQVFQYSKGSGLSAFFWSSGKDALGNHWLATSVANFADGSASWETQMAPQGSYSYQVVDHFQFAPPLSDDRSTHFSAADDGRVFVTGRSYLNNKTESHWIIRSPDAAGNWSTLLDGASLGFAVTAGFNTYAIGDHLVSVGRTGDAGKPLEWTVIGASSANPTQWEVWDRMDPQTVYSSVATCMSAGPNLVFAAGKVQATATAAPQTIVRTSADQGHTWKTTAVLTSPHGPVTVDVNNCTTDASGRLLITLFVANDSGMHVGGELQMSDDGGTTWKTIDDFYPAAATNVSINAPFIDDAGAIYVPYYGNWQGGTQGYLVRRSTDGGAHFDTIDTYHPQDPNLLAGASSISENGLGELLVGGYEELDAKTQAVSLRKMVP